VLTLDVQQGQEIRVEKVVALYSSRDHAICEPSLDARETVAAAGDFATLLAAHAGAWERLWERCDVFVKNSADDTQVLLRLHIFHLLQTTSMHSIDMDVGVPARGLHGEAYRGHVFWDELFIFPFLNWRLPEITRALLHYRYRRLPAARDAARAAGYAGAMFPWQSGSNGREETQTLHLNPMSGNWLPDNSQRQRHVNIAIAYNAWHHYAATDDRGFLAAHGAEMILDIARFLVSLCRYDATSERYHIAGVMGPDEYHDGYPDADPPCGIDDNAYTNVMTAWVLCRALDIMHHTLPCTTIERIAGRIGLDPDEPEVWDRISRRLYVPFHDDGIISQFAGYADLKELDWDAYRAKYGNIRRLDRILESEGDTPNAYKLSKQADLVMLFYLLSAEELSGLMERLGYPFKPEDIPRIVRYYMARTSHGSTLSGVVHAWVLARSVRTESWPFFLEALQADHMDVQGGTTREGIHLGAMAGTVDLVQRGYTGLEVRDGILWFNPVPPAELRDLRLRLLIRGAELSLEIASDTIILRSLDRLNPTLRVGYRDRVLDLHPGETLDFRVYCTPAAVG
jgi:alpha,alpha-trehalase